MNYYKLIDLVITPSSFYRDKLIQYRFPKEKVVHLANFVDVDSFEPVFEPEPYFLFFGRLAEEKGVSTLVEAMQKVKSGTLLIAGSGPMENEIRQIIDSLGLTNIELVGFLNKLQLKSLIQKSMFTILPSEWYENGPMSLLESFAYGKPVIGSNIGGIPEHIDDKINGLLFEAKDSNELAEKINWMMDNRTKTIEMGRQARKKAETHYSKKLHIQKILEIYEKACKN
jgi:glycosyltransferase involved in cell wall biosynthesis